jgi:phosphatidylinositol-3,4,5-trisphosphate 3-phosphatase/dual-specificity protein phosphatase PTEN
MNFLREMVAGKKKRFKEQGYNLDLTYVTPRIIAMSLPGEGMSGLYRNPIDQVATFLYKNHGPNHIVFNLSGHQYNFQKFNQVVSQY